MELCERQVLIWWAGLMRGAVSMALAYNQFTKEGHTTMPGNAIMITNTITVVLFSTIVRYLFFFNLQINGSRLNTFSINHRKIT
ncbi:putative cation/H+ exchanger, CPA1 family [Helianthus anomalus]